MEESVLITRKGEPQFRNVTAIQNANIEGQLYLTQAILRATERGIPAVDGIVEIWQGQTSTHEAKRKAYYQAVQQLVAFANTVEDIELLQMISTSQYQSSGNGHLP